SEVSAGSVCSPTWSPGTKPVIGTRPTVGRTAHVPVQWPGQRNDPPKSVPMPNPTKPAATAAASAPLDPPGEYPSIGLRVAPKVSLSVCIQWANSGVFVLPIQIAPAACSRLTAEAVRCGIDPSNERLPAVVGIPVTEI